MMVGLQALTMDGKLLAPVLGNQARAEVDQASRARVEEDLASQARAEVQVMTMMVHGVLTMVHGDLTMVGLVAPAPALGSRARAEVDQALARVARVQVEAEEIVLARLNQSSSSHNK